MTPVDPFTLKAIEELKPLAEKLNAESDDLNDIINNVSEKLAALNLGIAVFLDEPEDPSPGDVVVGFARIEDGKQNFWALACRNYREEWNQRTQSVEILHRDESLAKSSRNVRIKGLEALPRVIGRLKDEAGRKLEVIAEAKQLAAKL